MLGLLELLDVEGLGVVVVGDLELLAHPRIGWGTYGFPELGDVNRKTP